MHRLGDSVCGSSTEHQICDGIQALCLLALLTLCQTQQITLFNDGRTETVPNHPPLLGGGVIRAARATVGTEGGAEDLDCLCFVHTSMMAHPGGSRSSR